MFDKMITISLRVLRGYGVLGQSLSIMLALNLEYSKCCFLRMISFLPPLKFSKLLACIGENVGRLTAQTFIIFKAKSFSIKDTWCSTHSYIP